jgi:heme exporter protein C
MFVLFLLYLGYIAVWQAVEEPARAARIAGIVALVGVINVPIIKFSVEWWNTLHQPASLLRAGGPAIESSILTPLLWNMAGFALLFVTLLLHALRTEVLSRRLRQMELAQANAAH